MHYLVLSSFCPPISYQIIFPLFIHLIECGYKPFVLKQHGAALPLLTVRQCVGIRKFFLGKIELVYSDNFGNLFCVNIYRDEEALRR